MTVYVVVVQSHNHVRLSATPCIAVGQAALSLIRFFINLKFKPMKYLYLT